MADALAGPPHQDATVTAGEEGDSIAPVVGISRTGSGMRGETVVRADGGDPEDEA